MTLAKNNKSENLKWFDILILAFIFCGEGIINSTKGYIALLNGEFNIGEATEFSASDNYSALLSQSVFLGIALLYLLLRNFNFKQWNVKWNIKAVLYGVLIFLGGALLMDLYMMVPNHFYDKLPFPMSISALYNNETISTVIYSLFNGVYEELFFLGICLSVSKRDLKWVLPFSLVVRFSFHTYQGMWSAIGIGFIFGFYMYILYSKSGSKNLLPFFLAHGIADILGLAILWRLGI